MPQFTPEQWGYIIGAFWSSAAGAVVTVLTWWQNQQIRKELGQQRTMWNEQFNPGRRKQDRAETSFGITDPTATCAYCAMPVWSQGALFCGYHQAKRDQIPVPPPNTAEPSQEPASPVRAPAHGGDYPATDGARAEKHGRG